MSADAAPRRYWTVKLFEVRIDLLVGGYTLPEGYAPLKVETLDGNRAFIYAHKYEKVARV